MALMLDILCTILMASQITMQGNRILISNLISYMGTWYLLTLCRFMTYCFRNKLALKHVYFIASKEVTYRDVYIILLYLELMLVSSEIQSTGAYMKTMLG